MENSNSLNTGNKADGSGRKMIRCNSKGRRRSSSVVRANEMRWYENEIRAKILEIQQKKAQRCAYSVCPTSTNKAKQKLCEENEILSKAPAHCPLYRKEADQSAHEKKKDSLNICRKRKHDQQHGGAYPKQQKRTRERDANNCRSRSKSCDLSGAKAISQCYQPEDRQITCSSSCSLQFYDYSQPQYDRGESESEKGLLCCPRRRAKPLQKSYENIMVCKPNDITHRVQHHAENISNINFFDGGNHIVEVTNLNDNTDVLKGHKANISNPSLSNRQDNVKLASSEIDDIAQHHEEKMPSMKHDDNNDTVKVNNPNTITDVVERHKAKISNLSPPNQRDDIIMPILKPSDLNNIEIVAQARDKIISKANLSNRRNNHNNHMDERSEKVTSRKEKESTASNMELEPFKKSETKNLNKKKLSQSAYQITPHNRNASSVTKVENNIKRSEDTIRSINNTKKVRESIQDSTLKLKPKWKRLEESPKIIDGKSIQSEPKGSDLKPKSSDLPYTVKRTDLTLKPSDLPHTFVRNELKSQASILSQTFKRNEVRPKASDLPHTFKRNELTLKPSDLPHTFKRNELTLTPSDLPHTSKRAELKPKPSDLPHTSKTTELKPKPSDLPHTSKRAELKPKPSDLPHTSKKTELKPKPSDLPHTSKKAELTGKPSDLPHFPSKGNELTQKPSNLPHTPMETMCKSEMSNLMSDASKTAGLLPKCFDLPHTSKQTDLQKRFRDQLEGKVIGSAAMERDDDDMHGALCCPFNPPNFFAPSQPKLIITAVYIKEQPLRYPGRWRAECPRSYSEYSIFSEDDRSEELSPPPPPPPPSATTGASEHEEVNAAEEERRPLKKFSFKTLVSTSIKLKALQEKLRLRCLNEESLSKR
uniref:Uncharacterized protein n=1 Tax=Glossina pallidipes TaxID=7398 RepID=A0A1B0AJ21_GLOPL